MSLHDVQGSNFFFHCRKRHRWIIATHLSPCHIYCFGLVTLIHLSLCLHVEIQTHGEMKINNSIILDLDIQNVAKYHFEIVQTHQFSQNILNDPHHARIYFLVVHSLGPAVEVFRPLNVYAHSAHNCSSFAHEIVGESARNTFWEVALWLSFCSF